MVKATISSQLAAVLQLTAVMQLTAVPQFVTEVVMVTAFVTVRGNLLLAAYTCRSLHRVDIARHKASSS
jgi:hypothetical protein